MYINKTNPCKYLSYKDLSVNSVLEAGLLNIHFFTPCYILIMLYINVLSKCEFSLNVVKSNRNTEMFM